MMTDEDGGPAPKAGKPVDDPMVPLNFHYRPTCSAPGCSSPAAYKVAASWSDGTSWELKR